MARSRSSHGKASGLEHQFTARIAGILDIAPEQVALILNTPTVFSARINRLKVRSAAARDEVVAVARDAGIELTPLDWYPDAFTFTVPKMVLAEHELVRSGKLFIQNASSFLPPLALGAQPGEAVLDLCAAPGGKSSHIAALTDGACSLWVNDGIATRMPRVEDVAATLGFAPAHMTTHPAQYIDKYVAETFDRILLDAQCGGEGMIDMSRARPLEFWSLARIEKYRHLQTKMLTAAFALLKPGAVLVYSTCTFAPEENEMPINTLLARRDDAVIEPLRFPLPNVRPARSRWLDTTFDPMVHGALRVVPDGAMEGFFVARIRKLPDGIVRADWQPDAIDLAAVAHKASLS